MIEPSGMAWGEKGHCSLARGERVIRATFVDSWWLAGELGLPAVRFMSGDTG
jgi:hypothetical protein